MKICIACKQHLNLSEFYDLKVAYTARCKPCFRQQRKDRYKADPKKEAPAREKWKLKNKEKVKKYIRDRAKRLWHTDPEFRRKKSEKNKAYVKKRYHSDPEYRKKSLANSVKYHRQRYNLDPVYRARTMARGEIKDMCKGFYKLDYNSRWGDFTTEQLRKHLESLFKNGMTWDNRVVVWEVDHIIPISKAKTIEDVKELSKLSNLRPLDKYKNREKSNKEIFNETDSI